MEPVSGYGNDKFTASAAEKIKAAADCPDAQVYFLTGGTQTNMVVIDTLLRPYEGVVASSCGHVNTHEAGAIESTGHKVLTVPHKNGKLDADDLREYVQTFYADASHDHMVFPGMVYISHPSEYGTLYTKNELERLSAVCREFDMPLFLDGARLGYGLTAETDVTLALFTDGLDEKICAPAVKLAIKLRDGLKAKGYRFALESPTNQQFIIVENSRLPELQSKVVYSFIEKYDAEHTVIRLATSWATTEEQVDELLSIL